MPQKETPQNATAQNEIRMTAKRTASGHSRRALTTLTVALLGSAAAQEISTSLPLTSVGDKLMWTVGDQDLRLVVGVTGRVQLDVYSGQFDPQDYRSKNEYGDESYGGPVMSTFALIDAQGQVVKTQNFGVGTSDWQTFLNSDLAAGTYTLRVQTAGKGKNTFALRLNTISAAVEADRLNVNVHAKDWIPVLNVANPGGSLALQMYDGDGPTELEAQLRDSQGHVFPLKVSGDLAFDTLNVPAAAGNYTVYLRQSATAKQYSNTVAFSLEKDGQATPLTVVRADAVGRLDVLAELVLPDGNVPTTAEVSVGDRALSVNGSTELSLPAATYPVSVKPVTGAETTISAASVNVEKSKTAQVKVQVKPSVALNFVADKTQVCVGDVVTFTADASTTFERQPLPVSLRVMLPGGLTTTGETTLTTKVDAANPGRVSFEATATTAGTLEATASLLPWNQTQKLPIEVLPTATQIELRRAEVASALPGEVVTVSLSVRNTSGVNAPYRLVDAPGTGLTALDPVIFSGDLKPGETRTLSYRARVNAEAGADSTLKAKLSSNCDSVQESTGQFVAAVPVVAPPTPEVQAPVPPVAPVIVMARSSVVRIPFDAPRAATQLVVAHTPPAGATYVLGSSTLNGKALADPVAGPSGRLYWTTPGAPRGVLGYALKHQQPLPALETPALLGRYAQGRQEVLVGTIDLADLSAAETPTQATVSENAGAIKLPVAGTVFRDRDRVTVAVEGSSTAPTDTSALPTINGQPVAQTTLGQTTLDSAAGSARREFYGIQLRPGENVIGYGDQSVKVYLAGTPVTAQLTPVQLVADGTQPISIRLKLLDINGLTPGTPTVTVESSLDPLTSDAKPQIASQQITLKNGEGLLELPPISAPTRFTVRVLVGSGVITRSFEATPSATRVGVGFLSVTGSLGGGDVGGGFAYEARGQAYLETPLGAGKLYVAGAAAVRGGAGQIAETVKPDGTISTDPTAPTDMSPVFDKSQGLPNTANPLLRYPGYGDGSTEQIPLQGIDPVAFRYEHPDFSVSYRQAPLPIDVFSIGGNLTALSGYSRSNPQVAAFVAAIPGGLVTDNLPSNGTRVVRLSQSDVSPDSQSVDLVSVDRLTGAQTFTRLIPYADYTLDPVAGVLYFSRPVGFLDDAGNAQSLRVVYRVTAPDGNRQITYGAQVSGRLSDQLSVGAAAVQIDGVLSVGVRARYDSNSGLGTSGSSIADPNSFGAATGAATSSALTGDVLAAYAGGVLVDGKLAGHTDSLNYAASVRYQDQDYAGLNAGQPGLAAAGALDITLNSAFGIKLAGQYADGSYQLGRTTNQAITDGTGTTPGTGVNTGSGSGNQGGLVSLQGRYQTGGLRLGAGVQAGFGAQQGLAALVSAGYAAGAFDVSIDHAQPIGSGTLDPVTTAAAKVQVAENLTLVAQDVIDWGGTNPDGSTDPFSQQATIGLQTRLGGTNLSVGYDLPTSSGSGNRARFGVDTTLPLTDNFSVNLGGSYLYNLNSGTGDWNAGTSLRYASDALVASVGADVASTAGAFRTVLKTGLSYSLSDQLSVTLDATKVLGAEDQVGTSLALSSALRSGAWQGLAYVRYQDGSLGGTAPQVIGEANVEYHQPQFALRAGVAGRMLISDPGSLTFQPSVSGTYYLTDYIGVGVAGRAIFQPASNYSAYSLGLEGSLRALPGTWVTVGYNPVGFDGISGNVSTRQGLYLRLDLMLDEGGSK
jgi:hypothetical protein